jgi:hypothetical protein
MSMLGSPIHPYPKPRQCLSVFLQSLMCSMWLRLGRMWQ